MAAKAFLLVAYASFVGAYFTPHAALLKPQTPRAALLRTRPVFAALGADESFRMLGLAEDADYDEIMEAFDRLTAAAAGPKQKIQLQVAKDKIMDFRLNQRLTGKIQGMKGLDDRMVEEKKTLQDRVPKPLQGIVEIPTRSYWLWNAYAYSVVAFLPILGSSFASTSLSMGFGVCLYRLYNRGAPKSSGAMDAEFRPPKRKPLLLTAGITILTAMIGGCASQARAATHATRHLLFSPFFTARCRRPSAGLPRRHAHQAGVLHLHLHRHRLLVLRVVLQGAGRVQLKSLH